MVTASSNPGWERYWHSQEKGNYTGRKVSAWKRNVSAFIHMCCTVLAFISGINNWLDICRLMDGWTDPYQIFTDVMYRLCFSIKEVPMAAELLDILFGALNDTCIGLTHCSLVTAFGHLMPDSLPTLNSHLWSLPGIHQSVIKLSFCIISLKYVLLLPLFLNDNGLVCY